MRCAFTSQGSAAAPAPARAQGRGWAGLCESGTQRKGKGISVENSLQGYAPKQQKLTVLLLRRARTGWTWPGGRGEGRRGGGDGSACRDTGVGQNLPKSPGFSELREKQHSVT